MSKTVIGFLFILAGLIYGSTAFDAVSSKTLGWLIKNGWIKEPPVKKEDKDSLGPKPTIILYSLGLIIIGIFILWNRNS